jgi:hypothetical protein
VHFEDSLRKSFTDIQMRSQRTVVAATILVRIRAVLGSNLGQGIGISKLIRGFP